MRAHTHRQHTYTRKCTPAHTHTHIHEQTHTAGRSTSGRSAITLDAKAFPTELLNRELPESVDWREKGVVSGE